MENLDPWFCIQLCMNQKYFSLINNPYFFQVRLVVKRQDSIPETETNNSKPKRKKETSTPSSSADAKKDEIHKETLEARKEMLEARKETLEARKETLEPRKDLSLGKKEDGRTSSRRRREEGKREEGKREEGNSSGEELRTKRKKHSQRLNEARRMDTVHPR